MSGDASLLLEGVTKRFGEHTVVRDLNFRAEPGRIYGLIGPNGAGKTTTIRMIMDIIRPDSGTVRVLGGQMTDGNTKDRVGYLPEERGLYPKMRVEAVLAYFAQLKGLERAKINGEITTWLEKVELTKWRKNRIEELSKGMQQKIQLCCTFIASPEVVILDEPFSGLDPVNTDVMREVVLDAVRNKGRTVLFSTHVMDQAEQICDTIVLIAKGQKLVDGPVAEIKAEHGNNTIYIEYEGSGEALKQVDGITELLDRGRTAEFIPAPGVAVPDLARRVANAIALHRFELRTPSLHQIFKTLVRGKTGEGGASLDDDDAVTAAAHPLAASTKEA